MSAAVDPTVEVPAVVRARVGHRRTRPFDYAFAHRSTSWLVDADDAEAAIPSALRPVLQIRARDHLGSHGASLGGKVRHYLETEGVPWSASRILALTNARTFGHVFDPLTTYFVLDAQGELEGIIAEVHNTYGERHCYPLDVQQSPMSTTKEFYVSPFFAVEGRYDIRARLEPDRVTVSISLTQTDEAGEEHRVFHGYVTGAPRAASRSRVWRAFLRDPLASQRVSALIRWHGIKLWLRRLPVINRLPHRPTEGLA